MLCRRPYEIWSAKSLTQVSAILSTELSAEQISPLESIARADAPGTRERSLVIASREAGLSPWRFVFSGSLKAGDEGTWLSGVVGPGPVVCIVVLAWMSVVALFLLSGIVTVAVDLISGEHVLFVPWLVAPSAVLIASYGVHRAATASARVRWRATDQWLRDLLDARPSA